MRSWLKNISRIVLIFLETVATLQYADGHQSSARLVQ